MAARLSSFSSHPPIQSPLLKKAPDAVPPTDELVQLHKELELAKEKALERSKKANDDLKTIEESIRRMTEREKGKFKAIDKIKRERDCTYMLNKLLLKKKNSDVWTCYAYLKFPTTSICFLALCKLPPPSCIYADTPLPDAPDSKSSTSYHGQPSKSRIHSHPISSLPGSSSRSSLDPRRS